MLLPQVLDLKTWFAIAALLLLRHIYNALWRIPKHHRTLPWAGGYRSAIAQHLAAYASLKKGREFMVEAYDKYSKHGVVCMVPSFLAPQVVLPPTQLSWMLAQPDTVLNAKKSQFHMIEARYTMLEPSILDYPVHEHITERELRRGNLDQLAPRVADEVLYKLGVELDTQLPAGGEWKPVAMSSFLRQTLNATVNRAFAGKELSRSADYLMNADLYEADLVRTGLLMRLFPDWTKPVTGRILTLPNRLHNARCARHSVPFFAARVAQYAKDPDAAPNDVATYLVADAVRKPIARERTPDMLARRLIALGFAAIHTSNMTTTSFLLDIATNPECLRALEQEVAAVAAEANASAGPVDPEGGAGWSKDRVAKLVALDSALRESMRVSTFVAKGNNRRVVAPGGVDLPDGTHLDCGAFVCIPTLPMHNDPDIYPDAARFKYDRFVPKPGQSERETLLAQASTATTVPPYVSWGQGRHACPGRYFAVDLIKILVAILLEHYEIRVLDTRPASKWIAETPVPPLDAALQMRRRAVPLGAKE